MIRSMTGYGRGECSLHNRKIVAEIKSVNHRYNDITIKMPKLLNPLEDSIRKRLSPEINRGKTDVYITMESYSTDDIKISFNEATADLYVNELRKIVERYSLPDGVSLDLIARFPDLITVEKNMDEDKIRGEIDETLRTALGLALEAFVRMREAEGETLKKDIAAKTAEIKALVEKVRERAPIVAKDYSERLRARITEALASAEAYEADESRLLTEIAVFADKSCIDEEITRLSSHISQLEQILNDGDSVGRKLDFLMQEMNREINTIGSKSNDLTITRIVIDLKSESEKIREQIQNIE